MSLKSGTKNYSHYSKIVLFDPMSGIDDGTEPSSLEYTTFYIYHSWKTVTKTFKIVLRIV
jgi:hypothetical protein